MNNTIQLVKNFFDNNSWKYSFDEEKALFTTGVIMNNALGNIQIFISINQDYYTVYAVLNSRTEKEYLCLVSEYLHRANLGLLNGNFELDFRDGEVRYKTYVNFSNAQITEETVETSILVPIFMFDKYGKGLLKVMMGDENPENLIHKTEHPDINL